MEPMGKNIKINALKRRERFAKEYVANGYNKVKAYMAAFETDNVETAKSRVGAIMREPEVKRLIDQEIKEHYDELHVSAERIAAELASIAFADKEDEVYNTNAKLKALDMLQKQLGLQKQKIDANVDQVTTINVTIEE